MKNFDLIVIGGGPGGYTAAIRAAQLGQRVALVEQDKLGGVCLNRGCIPTKALMKSAHLVHELKHMPSFGIEGINSEALVLKGEVALARSREVAARVCKGVGFLMKKNKIEVISGNARLRGDLNSDHEIYNSENSNFAHVIEVTSGAGAVTGESMTRDQSILLEAPNIIIATGAHYKNFPGLEHDGKKILGAFEILALNQMPRSLGIIGAGAIGMEFAYFFNAFGVDVHIFEIMPRPLPLEDSDCSQEIERAYRNYGIKTSFNLNRVSAKNEGDKVVISSHAKGSEEILEHHFDLALLAIGMSGNIENIGLESCGRTGVKTAGSFIVTDEFGRTNVPGIYAIGDVAGPPLLAHVAAHQGIIAVEDMCKLDPHPINKNNIPSGVYCMPQVASVGLTETTLKEQKINYRVGKLPFMANGKAVASNEKEGFVKVLIGDGGELLGAHIVGVSATELLQEYTLLKSINCKDHQLMNTIHPHPTLCEWLSEAILLANGRAINF